MTRGREGSKISKWRSMAPKMSTRAWPIDVQFCHKIKYFEFEVSTFSDLGNT